MYGRTETLADGSTIEADAAYLGESIRDPSAKLVQGFPPVMAAYPFNDDDIDALIAYFITLAE
jgi:cytochrome c oxidase subunit 2